MNLVVGIAVIAGLLVGGVMLVARAMGDVCDRINQYNPDDEGAAWEAAQKGGRK